MMDSHIGNPQMTGKHVNRGPRAYVTRELQTQTSVRCHIDLLEWVKSKILTTPSATGDVGPHSHWLLVGMEWQQLCDAVW